MKPNLSILAIILVLLSSACKEDSLETTDVPVESNSATGIGEGDFINESEFNRTVTIIWSGNSAYVSGDEDGFVTVNGTRVTADSRSDTTKVVKYILSGGSTDGSFKLYSLRKQAIVLKNLTLTNTGGAAINNQSGKRTFVVIEGTNKLQDGPLSGSDYPEAVQGEDLKAAFFSEGQLVFSGNGNLTIYSCGKSGITSDDYLRFLGTHTIVSASSSGHAFRGKDAIRIDDGTFIADVTAAGKKGFSSDGSVTINGGDISISVSGGVLSETTDEGVELTGSAGIKSDGVFTISGGNLTINSSGQGGKGISGDSAGIFCGGTVNVTVTGSNYGSSSQGGFGPGGGPGRPGGGWSGQGTPGGTGTSSDNSKGAKGIKFDGDITVSGGVITVSCQNHEAFEAKGAITVTGGELYAFSASEDAINRGGSDTSKDFVLSGGYVCGWSTGNDGIDSNGNIYLKGSTVYAVSTKGSPEVAVDANSEARKALYLQSGTLVSVGGLENGSYTGCYSTTAWNKNGWHTLYGPDGSARLTFKAPASSSNGTMVIYADGKQPVIQKGGLEEGGTPFWNGYGYADAVLSDSSEISLSSYKSGGTFR